MYPRLCSVRRIGAALVLALAAACSRGDRHAHAAASAPMAVDWANVSSRDLNVASVFLVARDVGLRQALDSLGVLASRDSTLRPLGHGIAHGLGRFAVARHGYDLSIIAECRPTFFSGCYHGVLEGYLSGRHAVDASALRGVCTSPRVLAMAPYVFRECAHGLGHGLTGVRGHDVFAALGDCAAVLPGGVARSECRDGVFMENVVHAMGTNDVNVGDAMAAHHAQAVHDARLLRASDPAFPCDSVSSAEAQPSCWAYQPVVFFQAFRGDMHRVVDGCARAPASSVGACFRGLGKQTIGRLPSRPDEVIRICRGTGDAHAADCLAGVVEFYVDQDWKADDAFAFCARLSSAEKAGCYAAVGQRVAWIDPAPDADRRACAAAGDAYAAACVRAAVAEDAQGVIARAAAWTPPPGAHPLPAPPPMAHEHGMAMPSHPG